MKKTSFMKALCLLLCLVMLLSGCSSAGSTTATEEQSSTKDNESSDTAATGSDIAGSDSDSAADSDIMSSGNNSGSAAADSSAGSGAASDGMGSGNTTGSGATDPATGSDTASANAGTDTTDPANGSDSATTGSGAASDTAASDTDVDTTPTLGTVTGLTATGLSFENAYIQKHLDFINGEDYAKLITVPGGNAAGMSREYREKYLDRINFFWKGFSSFSLFVGGLEYDITDEYQLLVGSLMQSSAAREAFNDSCEQGYLLSMEEMLGGISQLLKNTEYVTYFANPDNLETLDSIADDIDEIANDLGALKIAGNMGLEQAKAKLPEYYKVYGEKWTAVKEKLGLLFDEKDARFLKGLLNGLSYAEGIETAVSDSFSEVMDQYLILSTCRRATEEYLSTWESIAAILRSGDAEEQKVAKAIDSYINKINGSKTDIDAQLIKTARHAAANNAAKWGLGLVDDELDRILDTIPVIAGIRLGLSGGIKLGNYITNLDDSGYYGKMIMGGGIIAEASYEVMKKAENALVSDNTYSNTILFDEAFNIYKNVLMATNEYGIDYFQSIATAPIGHILKYAVDDEILGADLLAIDNLLISTVFCHYGSEVKNNGRPVVGLDSEVYYINFNENSFEKTGVLGNFTANSNATNKLTRLVGQDFTTIASTQANRSLYIWNGNILLSKNYLSWSAIGLDGTPDTLPGLFGSCEILGASEAPCMLVYTDYEKQRICVLDAENKLTTLGSSDGMELLGFHGDSAYFAKTDKSSIAFYRFVEGTDYLQPIGQINIPVEDSMSGCYIGTVLFEDDGIYLTAGIMGGTGYFYSNGGLFRIDYEMGIDTLISCESKNALSFTALYLKRGDNGDRYIYFASGVSYSNAGAGNRTTSEGVHCYDLQTGAVTAVEGFTLSEKNRPFLSDTAILAYADDSGIPCQIMTKKRANNLGFKNLGAPNESTYSFVYELDIIDNYAYLWLRSMKRDDSASIGWRQGYSLVKSGLYRINLADSNEKIFTINEY